MITLNDIKKKARPIFKKEGVIRAAVFGSFATGYADKKSDVDVLVQMRKDGDLFDLARIKIALEEKLQRKVDILTYKGIHPYLRRRILKEKKTIYER